MFGRHTADFIAPEDTLPGRDASMPITELHHVSGRSLLPPFPEGMETAVFGMGCVWGAERIFGETPGVWVTAVGYAGGQTPNPAYQEVCSGLTNHNEVVLVVFDPEQISYQQIVKVFWENHDPTQGFRQGNDVGTQYRSGIYAYGDAQREAAIASVAPFAAELARAGYGAITTEIVDGPAFYYAEDYHQQYLSKNPMGYCGIGGTGVTCPIGLEI